MSKVVDTSKFDRDVDKYLKHLQQKEIPDLLTGIGIQAVSEFSRLTPVEFGRAKAGWNPALQGLGAPAGGGGEGSIEKKFSGDNPHIDISNRVHYIIYLEYGHSKRQAPHGMVRRTLRKMKRKLDSAGMKGILKGRK